MKFLFWIVIAAVSYWIYVWIVVNPMPKATGAIDEFIIDVGRRYGECEYHQRSHCEMATQTYEKLREMISDGRFEGDSAGHFQNLEAARSAGFGRWNDTEWIRNFTGWIRNRTGGGGDSEPLTNGR